MGSYPRPVETVTPPAERADVEWHVLLDADSRRHRLRWDAGHSMWCTETAQVMTAEQAYRRAWLYVGPAR